MAIRDPIIYDIVRFPEQNCSATPSYITIFYKSEHNTGNHSRSGYPDAPFPSRMKGVVTSASAKTHQLSAANSTDPVPRA